MLDHHEQMIRRAIKLHVIFRSATDARALLTEGMLSELAVVLAPTGPARRGGQQHEL